MSATEYCIELPGLSEDYKQWSTLEEWSGLPYLEAECTGSRFELRVGGEILIGAQ